MIAPSVPPSAGRATVHGAGVEVESQPPAGNALSPGARIFLAVVATALDAPVAFGMAVVVMLRSVPTCGVVTRHELAGPAAIALVLSLIPAAVVAGIAGFGSRARVAQRVTAGCCALVVVGAAVAGLLLFTGSPTVSGWCF